MAREGIQDMNSLRELELHTVLYSLELVVCIFGSLYVLGSTSNVVGKHMPLETMPPNFKLQECK